MEPTLRHLKLYAFDLHTCLPPLFDASAMRPELAFLLGRSGYNSAYQGGTELPGLPFFQLGPLSRRTFGKNHFWSNYRQIWFPGMPVASSALAWERQLPFLLSPRRREISYHPLRPDLSCGCEPYVLLWPFGWSSNLEISVHGSLSLDEVRTLTAEIRTGSPFHVAGKEATLSEAFRHLSQQVQSDLHAQAVRAPMAVARRLVIATLWEGGVPPDDSGAGGPWSRGILFDPKGEDREKPFFGTHFRGTEFALTYQHFGLLLALSAGEKRTLRSLRCMASNLHDMLVIVFALLYLYRARPETVGQSPTVDELTAAAKPLLLALPETYRNPVCRQLIASPWFQGEIAAVDKTLAGPAEQARPVDRAEEKKSSPRA
jgi:hypothetical protein